MVFGEHFRVGAEEGEGGGGGGCVEGLVEVTEAGAGEFGAYGELEGS